MPDAKLDRGWYPDPDGPGRQRLWDGSRWTVHYASPPKLLDKILDAPSVPDDDKSGGRDTKIAMAIVAFVLGLFIAPCIVVVVCLSPMGRGFMDGGRFESAVFATMLQLQVERTHSPTLRDPRAVVSVLRTFAEFHATMPDGSDPLTATRDRWAANRWELQLTAYGSVECVFIPASPATRASSRAGACP